jgi:hypothetical protein
MTCLSIFERSGKGAVVVANPIFIISENVNWRGGQLEFEVFDADIARLKTLVGRDELFVIGTERVFWGKLVSLEQHESTHPGLAMLRHKPTRLGIMTVHEDEAASRQ